MSGGRTQDSEGFLWIEINSVVLQLFGGVTPDSLRVSIKDIGKRKRNKSSWILDAPQLPTAGQAWKPTRYCALFCGSKIQFTAFASSGQVGSCSPNWASKKIGEIEVAESDIRGYCSTAEIDSGIFEPADKSRWFTARLHFACKELSSIQHTDHLSTEDIERLENGSLSFSLPESFIEDKMHYVLKAFRSFAKDELIDEPLDSHAVQTTVKRLIPLANIHDNSTSVLNVIIRALLIPYKMLDRRDGVVVDVTGLANDMCMALKAVVDVLFASYTMEVLDKETTIRSILRSIVNAYLYVEVNLSEGRTALTAVSAVALYVDKLNTYRSTLRDLGFGFRELLDFQDDGIGGRKGSSGLDVLREKLKLTGESQTEGIQECFPGTQAKSLKKADVWINQYFKSSNVLWISGAPGAGCTTFAFTIFNSILRERASSFFCRGKATNLRTIWPSIAYRFAQLDRGIRFDLLKTLLDHGYQGDISIKDQFRKFIYEPLRKHYPANSNQLWRMIVIIDALDKCDQRDLNEFMQTIVEWHNVFKSSNTCKLIVTSNASKENAMINSILGTVCDVKRIPNRDEDNVVELRTEDSDIELFYRTKFRSAFGDSGPGLKAVGVLTRYASGSFAWAATLVDSMTRPKGPEHERLGKLLLDRSAGHETEDRLRESDESDLYALILSLSLVSLGFDVQGCNGMSLVLATSMLLKDEIRKKSHILEILDVSVDLGSSEPVVGSTAQHHDGNRHNVEAAVKDLSPLLFQVAEETSEDLQALAIRERFASFLREKSVIHSSVMGFLDNMNASKSNLIQATFSIARQHALLSERCLSKLGDSRLAELFQSASAGLLRKTTYECFTYAYSHWLHHRRFAGEHYYGANGHEDPREAHAIVQTIPSLQDHTILWLDILSKLETPDNAFARLTGRVSLSALQNSIISISNLDSSEWSLAKAAEQSTGFETKSIVFRLEKLLRSDSRTKVSRSISHYSSLKALASEVCDLFGYVDERDGDQQLSSTSADSRARVILKEMVRISKLVLESGGDPGHVKYQMAEYCFQKRSKAIRYVIESQKLAANHARGVKSQVVPDYDDLFESTRNPWRSVIPAAVDAWLRSVEDLPNVIWISGNPGNGRYLVTPSMIARDFIVEEHKAYDCFASIESHVLGVTWLCAANYLVHAFQDVGENVWKLLLRRSEAEYSEISDLYYPPDISIEDQFLDLIYNPLKAHSQLATGSMRKIVVIIDVLLEERVVGADYEAFLGTLKLWRSLPQVCKLVIISHTTLPVGEELEGICHSVVFKSGEVAPSRTF